MLWKLLILFVVVPLIELTLLLGLGHRTGPLVPLLVVIATGFAGTLLARMQGWKTFRRIQVELSEGKLPTNALLDATMIFCAGALLLTPGMLTDAFGMSLLIPFTRRWYRRRLLAWIRNNFKVQAFNAFNPNATPFDPNASGERSQVIDSYVVDPTPIDERRSDDSE